MYFYSRKFVLFKLGSPNLDSWRRWSRKRFKRLKKWLTKNFNVCRKSIMTGFAKYRRWSSGCNEICLNSFFAEWTLAWIYLKVTRTKLIYFLVYCLSFAQPINQNWFDVRPRRPIYRSRNSDHIRVAIA